MKSKQTCEIKKLTKGDHIVRERDCLSYLPKINIFLPILKLSSHAGLVESIESVCNQTYHHWQLSILISPQAENVIKDKLEFYTTNSDKIQVIYANTESICPKLNELIGNTNADFCGVLDTGRRLDDSFLMEVVKVLNKNPKCELIYTDERLLDEKGEYVANICRPGYSPDLLLATNYMDGFTLFRRTLLQSLEGYRKGIDPLGQYDLILRAVEKTNHIVHIPKILGCQQVKRNPQNLDESIKQLLLETLARRKTKGEVGSEKEGFRIRYQLKGEPLVSIIIPIRDKVSLLRQCIESIINKSSYQNFEIIVMNNNSEEEETYDYLKEIVMNQKIKVLDAPFPFNWSRLNNLGAKEALGAYYLFLNNDTEVVTNDWLENMLGYAQQSHVGVVGSKLLFPDHTIQHGGVYVDKEKVAWHALYKLPNDVETVNDQVYNHTHFLVRNFYALTGACMMIKRDIFEATGGFDEVLDVAFNDIDICLKVVQLGYYNVMTPNSTLYHYEKATRGQLHPEHNTNYFLEKWEAFLGERDPFDIETKGKISYFKKQLTAHVKGKSVMIWGSGSGGIKTLHLLNEVGYSPHGFIDKNSEKWGAEVSHLRIYPPSILEEKQPPCELFIVVGSQYYSEIKTELDQLGLQEEINYLNNPLLF
jgi:GT2 family glycosyltransferase